MNLKKNYSDYLDKEISLQKPYYSSYDINARDSDKLNADIQIELNKRMHTSRKCHETLFIGDKSVRNNLIYGENNLSLSDTMYNSLATQCDLEQTRDLTELSIAKEIDDFHEFFSKIEWSNLSSYIHNVTENEPISLFYNNLSPREMLDYYTRQDTEWVELNDFAGLLNDNLLIRRRLNYQSEVSDWHDEFITRLESILEAKRLLKALSKKIDFLLNLLKKRLRNLRQFFKKQHSFHFKNLDDYHSSALTSVLVG